MSNDIAKRLSVFLFRVNDRNYGFRVVAAVAENENRARWLLKERYHARFDDNWRRGYATLVDECACRDQASASLEWEE